MKIIKNVSLNDAITVYNIMKKRGDGNIFRLMSFHIIIARYLKIISFIEISDESKQALLELVCYLNETEEIPSELIEEKWYSQTAKGTPAIKKTWKLVNFIYTINVEPIENYRKMLRAGTMD